jgi:hypothetical protein
LQEDDDSEESEDSEECEDSDESRDGKLSEDSIDSEDREEGENKMENAKHVEMEAEPEMFEVGDFVAAVYEGQWLLAQVDIDQDQAGDTHINLAYMERVGKNQFKWPKQDDRLLTLREDILFKCDAPILVGSSIRASHVGLPGKQAAQADAALVLVVYLQKSLFLSLFTVFHIVKGHRVFCGGGGRVAPSPTKHALPLHYQIFCNVCNVHKDPKVRLLPNIYS